MNTFFESQIWPLKNRLYRTAYLWIKDRDAANDAVQEVFSKAWVNRKMLEQRENPTGWLVKTLKNQVLHQIREAKKRNSMEKVEEVWVDPEEETYSVSHAVKMVFAFLKDLPEKQREVFQLREVEGLTYEEIAVYMEIPMEQVKVNLNRARKKLREFLLNRK